MEASSRRNYLGDVGRYTGKKLETEQLLTVGLPEEFDIFYKYARSLELMIYLIMMVLGCFSED